MHVFTSLNLWPYRILSTTTVSCEYYSKLDPTSGLVSIGFRPMTSSFRDADFRAHHIERHDFSEPL